MDFKTVYRLIIKEEFVGENHNDRFFDNASFISQKEFLTIAETHFYEKELSYNVYSNFHKLFFILLSNDSFDNHKNNLSCIETLIKLLPFLNDSPIEKTNLFICLNRYNLSYDKYSIIPNKKFKYTLRSYVVFNLVFVNKFILDLSQQNLIKDLDNHDIERNSLNILKNFNNNKIRSFLTNIHYSLNPASVENLPLNKINEILLKNSYIFNYFDLKKSFLIHFSDKKLENNNFAFESLYDEEYLDC